MQRCAKRCQRAWAILSAARGAFHPEHVALLVTRASCAARLLPGRAGGQRGMPAVHCSAVRRSRQLRARVHSRLHAALHGAYLPVLIFSLDTRKNRAFNDTLQTAGLYSRNIVGHTKPP